MILHHLHQLANFITCSIYYTYSYDGVNGVNGVSIRTHKENNNRDEMSIREGLDVRSKPYEKPLTPYTKTRVSSFNVRVRVGVCVF